MRPLAINPATKYPEKSHSGKSRNPENTGCRIKSGMTKFLYLIAGLIINVQIPPVPGNEFQNSLFRYLTTETLDRKSPAPMHGLIFLFFQSFLFFGTAFPG
jgi:hypothetical protein